MICEQCSASIPDGSKFCPKCGKKFTPAKICPFNANACNANCALRYLGLVYGNDRTITGKTIWKCSITGIAESIQYLTRYRK